MFESVGLFTGGILHIAFVIFHLYFWRLFNWKDDLKSLTPINKSVMPVMNICLIVVFITNAYISLFQQHELITTKIGHIYLLSVALFWAVRTVLQRVYFDIRKPFSILLTIIFLCLIILYLLPAFS